MTKNKTTGYKAFNKDWTCRGFQYEVGKTYIMKEIPVCCNQGFHFCTNIADCFKHYANNPESTKIALVEALGDIDKEVEDSKCCTNKIKIVKEISFTEAYELGNRGKCNTGFGNAGNWNTGDRNTGNRNAGNWNTGDRNAGNSNAGNWNTGDRNAGDSNTGNWNTGDRNTGNRNAGNWNTGDRNAGNSNAGNWNTGDRNAGDSNTGNWNTGDRNTGNRNAGNCNAGDSNTGNWNTGDRNAGDRNTGNRNTGSYNTCNYSAGMFNTKEQPLYLFNKPTDFTRDEFRNIFPNEYALLFYSLFPLTEWIDERDMSDKEKKANPSYKTTGGYLKERTYHEAWRIMWDSWTKKQQESIKNLPNFDKDIFKEITGIEVAND